MKYSSVGRISEWRGLRSKAPRECGWKILHFIASKSHVCDALAVTPFWSNFITGWKWTTMHKMFHFAMLQITKYCSRIQVKTHSTTLAINFLCKQTTHMGDLHTVDRKLCWQMIDTHDHRPKTAWSAIHFLISSYTSKFNSQASWMTINYYNRLCDWMVLRKSCELIVLRIVRDRL